MKLLDACVLLLAFAVQTAWANPSADLDERLQLFSSELRCLVCQNEALADSNAPLAVDLKREIRSRMEAGHSNEQIRGFLIERYGDFVTYKPPLDARTALLWAAPWLLLLGGGLALRQYLRQEQADESGGDAP
jgi:cytochrome c-type biogenesis protein CcmH/NrfF